MMPGVDNTPGVRHYGRTTPDTIVAEGKKRAKNKRERQNRKAARRRK